MTSFSARAAKRGASARHRVIQGEEVDDGGIFAKGQLEEPDPVGGGVEPGRLGVEADRFDHPLITSASHATPSAEVTKLYRFA